LTDAELRYTFTCPSCSGNFSIQLDRIPPIQARFSCPHCKQPMDFPSREEARVSARLQADVAVPGKPSDPPPEAPASARAAEPPPPAEGSRFQVVKAGFGEDVFDRRGIRNLIRTGEIEQSDPLRVDDGEPVRADDLPYLKSLFNLRKTSRTMPPRCCRTHDDKVAFFLCEKTARPLCEDCAPEKKFGGTTIRVCQHCGGTATELQQA